jgi:hypothetical protein
MSLILNDAYQDDCYLPSDSVCVPNVIKKSSVGEFYEKTLREIIASTEHMKLSQKSRALLLPMAVGREVGDECPDKVLYHLHSEVKEDCNRTLNNAYPPSNEFIQHLNLIETISQSICSKYQPRMDIPSVQILKTDMNHLEEYAIAQRLYKWVTHPMSQVRLIVPALSEEIRNDVKGTFEINDCDIGLYVVDCEDNFLTYLDIQAMTHKYYYPKFFFQIHRQFWTPFFKFKLNDEMNRLDAQDLLTLNDIIAKSTRLYYEILKTGLKYEAQYALLAGFTGRFYMTFNTRLPDLTTLAFRNSLNTDSIMREIKDILKRDNIPDQE